MQIQPLNRSDLIDRMSDLYPTLPRNDMESAVKIILGAMSDALASGSRIEIRGFGSFSLSHRKARPARNPRTGERIDVRERYVPHFRAGREMRKALGKKDTQADADN